LNRPDIVEKAIILASAEQAVREAPGTTFKLADLLARPVPRFTIISPLADEVQGGASASTSIQGSAMPAAFSTTKAAILPSRVPVRALSWTPSRSGWVQLTTGVVKRLLVNGAGGKDEPTGTNILAWNAVVLPTFAVHWARITESGKDGEESGVRRV
jgi:hypothetical protein